MNKFRTIKIYDLLQNDLFELFDFKYRFYSDDILLREQFETDFLNYYAFKNIGFETVFEFKWKLKTKLDLLSRKYEQLYISELKSKDIEFLLNKDLKEEFIKDIERENNGNENSKIINTSEENTVSDLTNLSKNNSETTNNNNSENNFIESNRDNGLSDVSLSTDNITNVNKNSTSNNENNINIGTNETNQNSVNKNNSTINTNNEKVLNNKGIEKEKTLLISKGNIGTTSSASLLEDWRNVMININLMLIEEFKDLFLMIY